MTSPTEQDQPSPTQDVVNAAFKESKCAQPTDSKDVLNHRPRAVYLACTGDKAGTGAMKSTRRTCNDHTAKKSWIFSTTNAPGVSTMTVMAGMSLGGAKQRIARHQKLCPPSPRRGECCPPSVQALLGNTTAKPRAAQTKEKATRVSPTNISHSMNRSAPHCNAV